MHLQFIREFVSVICLFCDNNIIIIRNERRVKESFGIFVKHTSLLSFVVILKEVSLFSSYLKSFFEGLVGHCHRYYLFSWRVFGRPFCLIEGNRV